MILDTFYMLFKSDASTVTKDVAELEKRVDALREKGKKRSDQENKDLKELTRQQKEMNLQLKEAENSYSQMAESLVKVAAGVVSVGAVVRAVFKQSELNSSLQVQSKLINQTTSDLKAYGLAAEAAGGAKGATGQFIQNLFERFSAVGLGDQVPELEKVYEKIRRLLKQAGTPGQREAVFQKFGITDVGQKSLLSSTDEEYEKAIALQKQLTDNTERGAEVARAYEKSWSEVGSALDGVFTAVGTKVLPAIEELNNGLVKVLNFSKDVDWIKVITEIPTGGSQTLTSALYTAFFGDDKKPPVNRGAQGNSSISTKESDIAFWMSKGYTREQAAAWVAAAHAESGNNPRAIGDGGKAKGLFQWHPDRRANILKGTGINIDTATHEEQLIAAAWEAQQRGDDLRIKSAGNARSAAAIHTRYFERPADMMGETVRRGQAALDIANGTTLGGNTTNSKSINVKVGDVNIQASGANSQAIAGDVSSELKSQIQMAISNLDDGVKY